MAPDTQSAKARLHGRILLGFCKTGVLTTATMATRLPRKAKTQSGTFTATRTASLMKAAVSLTGITSCAGRPQMLLFVSEVILIHWWTRDTGLSFLPEKKENICLIQNLRTNSEQVNLKKFTNALSIMFLIAFTTYNMIWRSSCISHVGFRWRPKKLQVVTTLLYKNVMLEVMLRTPENLSTYFVLIYVKRHKVKHFATTHMKYSFMSTVVWMLRSFWHHLVTQLGSWENQRNRWKKNLKCLKDMLSGSE